MKYYKELLTIGIPAYNEGKYIRKTIDSCINQAARVIISDNASTDDTQKICEELAKKYSNLIYIRHQENQGGTWNFNFVLAQAKTKYFMWSGGHDYLDEGYSSHILHMLENTDAVGCYPACRHVDNDDLEIGIYDFWYADRLASDFPAQRVYCLIAHLHDVSALFGIYRTEIAQKYPMRAMLGNDHVFVCNMAREGRLLYASRSIYNWRQTKLSFSDADHVKAWQKSLGNAQNKIDASRKQMQLDQIDILKKCSSRGFGVFGKIFLVAKACKKLRKRFGD
ncbi:MAG: glycosyltransferase family 2 protein [Proteobacteria bacterium]|nr:glycosyltransferase family 2 protein [Pseudomonadota bacterium]